jgi:hypothetical protein
MAAVVAATVADAVAAAAAAAAGLRFFTTADCWNRVSGMRCESRLRARPASARVASVGKGESIQSAAMRQCRVSARVC